MIASTISRSWLHSSNGRETITGLSHPLSLGPNLFSAPLNDLESSFSISISIREIRVIRS
jgi:hypothetical protein